MADLLDSLTDPQQRLVEIVAEVFLQHRRWPIFDYIEKMLDRVPLDASLVLASFPGSDRLYGGGPYSAVWSQGGANDRPVKLTVLGLHHSKLAHRDPRYPPLEEAFFVVLGHLINLYRTVEPSPFEIRTAEADGEEIDRVLKQAGHDWLPLEGLFDLLKHEPATWYGNANELPDGSRRWIITRHVMDYDGVTDVVGYVERMAALAPAPPTPPRVALPATALPAAFDHLDAIWRLVPAHHESLLVLLSAERATKLGQPVATENELASALSALGEVLTSLHIPKVAAARRATRRRSGADPTLERLRAYLLDKIPEGGHARADAAIDKLQHVVDLRHGSHHGHSDTRSKAAAAYKRLRIGYPPNPALAWETVQAETVAALNDIREELAPLTR